VLAGVFEASCACFPGEEDLCLGEVVDGFGRVSVLGAVEMVLVSSSQS